MSTLAEAAGNMAEYTHDAEEVFLSQCIADPVTGHDLAVTHGVTSHSFAYAVHSCTFANVMASAVAGIRPSLTGLMRLCREGGVPVDELTLRGMWRLSPITPTDYEALQVKELADRRTEICEHLQRVGELLCGDTDFEITITRKAVA